MRLASKYYEAQKSVRDNDKREDFIESWLKPGTVDAWRHTRMLSVLNPLLEVHSGASWLTIGDGRFASDTRYILSQDPLADVTTSDISEALMAEALRRGLIQKYSIENCEMLNFPDDRFDFVLCKESFHHFPRPYVALYEMIRVARKAVVLIEPHDSVLAAEKYQKYLEFTDGYISTKDILRALLRKFGLISLVRRFRGFTGKAVYPDTMADFEEGGNFVYGISEREMEKVALGIGLPVIALSGMNDYYEEGVEFEEVSSQSSLFKKVQAEIAKAESTKGPNVLRVILFRFFPDSKLASSMEKLGVKMKTLPVNPYLS